MGSQLQQVLRSLCFDTDWKYAIFWKLNHRTKMMFTWEDAYYDNDCPDKNSFCGTSGSLNNGPSSCDPLGLAVAKMSYKVYSIGEGIVGQVTVSGKHSWTYSDRPVGDSSAIFEYFGGWQSQFSAGVKTIAVVPVIPHGVLQLGSLHKIVEDLKLVNHIQNLFSELKDSSSNSIPSSLQSTTESSSLSDVYAGIPDSAVFHDTIMKLGNSSHEDEISLWSQLFPSVGSNSTPIFPPSGFSSQNRSVKILERAECSVAGSETSLPPISENVFMAHPIIQEQMKSFNEAQLSEETNEFRGPRKKAENMSFPCVNNARNDNSLLDDTQQTEEFQRVASSVPSEVLHSLTVQDRGELYSPENPSEQLYQYFEKNLEFHQKSNDSGTHLSHYGFCAGYELYEALEPFQKRSGFVLEAEKTRPNMAIEISEGMGSSGLLIENPDVQLLDALVAKVSHKAGDTKATKSCCDTEGSLLSAEKTPCTSIATISSASYSFDQSTSGSLSSVACGTESLKVLLSPNSSRGSGHLERSRDPVMLNKKRTKTGENCRPRPRDRQLIQDRIKELRDLVPSGSKCSIDSLLERTIKHMLFLQSITKHAEKLHKCSVSKLLDKGADMRRFSCEQGSSWAVEVGNNPKVYPIIVENINMNRQMLVEMLCQHGSHFLDIAETIRSLGLTILKGFSEIYGDKTWMCFVVENNQSLHRMDVLWSLMTLLQSKIAK